MPGCLSGTLRLYGGWIDGAPQVRHLGQDTRRGSRRLVDEGRLAGSGLSAVQPLGAVRDPPSRRVRASSATAVAKSYAGPVRSAADPLGRPERVRGGPSVRLPRCGARGRQARLCIPYDTEPDHPVHAEDGPAPQIPRPGTARSRFEHASRGRRAFLVHGHLISVNAHGRNQTGVKSGHGPRTREERACRAGRWTASSRRFSSDSAVFSKYSSRYLAGRRTEPSIRADDRFCPPVGRRLNKIFRRALSSRCPVTALQQVARGARRWK